MQTHRPANPPPPPPLHIDTGHSGQSGFANTWPMRRMASKTAMGRIFSRSSLFKDYHLLRFYSPAKERLERAITITFMKSEYLLQIHAIRNSGTPSLKSLSLLSKIEEINQKYKQNQKD